jgi:hypothetical protein
MGFHYDSFMLGITLGMPAGIGFFWLGYWGAHFYHKRKRR